jgi:hypothetical protein
MVMLRGGRIMYRRIVTQNEHLCAAKSGLTIDFGPPSVVADCHAYLAAESLNRIEVVVAWLEIALFQVLKGAPGLALTVSRQMNLAITANDSSAALIEIEFDFSDA